MEIERRALVPDVPKDILFYTVELIGESLIMDAKEKFEGMPNFDSMMNLEKMMGRPWKIDYYVKFSVYTYEFHWEFKDSKNGVLVKFVGKVPSHWWNTFFDIDTKLEGITDSQWTAFTNFAIGYMTAKMYEKRGKKRDAREHVRVAKSKMGKTSKKKKK